MRDLLISKPKRKKRVYTKEQQAAKRYSDAMSRRRRLVDAKYGLVMTLKGPKDNDNYVWCQDPKCRWPEPFPWDLIQIEHVNSDGALERKRTTIGNKNGTSPTYYNKIHAKVLNGSKGYKLACCNCNNRKAHETGEFTKSRKYPAGQEYTTPKGITSTNRRLVNG